VLAKPNRICYWHDASAVRNPATAYDVGRRRVRDVAANSELNKTIEGRRQ